jgi:hypothetical protein
MLKLLMGYHQAGVKDGLSMRATPAWANPEFGENEFRVGKSNPVSWGKYMSNRELWMPTGRCQSRCETAVAFAFDTMRASPRWVLGGRLPIMQYRAGLPVKGIRG